MKQFNPFSEVNAHRGAPMGRRDINAFALKGLRILHARHQGGGDGYDKGGAYWGTPGDVWAVWGMVDGVRCVAYVRAHSRDHAIEQVRNG